VWLLKSARMPFHTDLRKVFEALGWCETQFRWLLSSVDAWPGVSGLPDELLPKDDAISIWVSGSRLHEIVTSYDFQLVWGVLLGFDLNHSLDEEMELTRSPTPLDFRGAIQHPAAALAIVAFDSTWTAVAARDRELEQAFASYFPEAREWPNDDAET
jgi:hypothetical protein